MDTINHPLLVLLLSVLLSGCSEEQQTITPSGNTIKIAVIGPMSGPEKALGKEGLEGIQTALHMHPYLNNGDGIKLVVADDHNDPERTVETFEKLVETEKVAAVLLLSTSASALAVNDIADNHRVPVLVLLATHPEISTKTQFVTQIIFDNTIEGKVAALFVRDELLLERVAVFKNTESFYSSSLADEFIRTFRSTEGLIIEVNPITAETVDYEETLTRLRDHNVQLLYLPVTAEDVVAISKTLQKIDWKPQLMGGDSLLTNVLNLQRDKDHRIDGLLTIEPYSNTLEATTYGKKAAKVFRSLFTTTNSAYPASGFEAMAILLDAMNRCHDPAESECINTRLHSTIDFKGIMGNITIRPDGKTQRPLVVNRIQGEKLEFIVKVY